MRRVWGVDSISQINMIGRWIDGACLQFKLRDEPVRLFRHPELLIPHNVISFVTEYDYATKFGSSIDYSDRQACWVEAWKTYEYYNSVVRS